MVNAPVMAHHILCMWSYVEFDAVAEFHAKAKTGNCVFVVAQHAIYKIYEMYGIP